MRSPGHLVFAGREDQIANAILSGDMADRAEQREGRTFAVHRSWRAGNVMVRAAAGSAFPDREADQLQAFEHAVLEVQFGVGEFSGRVSLVRSA